ncbi:MAG TPA: hypothetical protein DCQ64_00400 [Candidatus Rokubacteria bacterium]|nr:hypothetical protein [Candidatus Rokubacteria bacterium]
MAVKQRIPLARAETLAAEVVGLLSPACTRLEIAGSIRRRKPHIGDIEIVAVPKRESLAPLVDLFGNTLTVLSHNVLDALIEHLLMCGILGRRLDVNGRTAVGERYKRLSYRGFGLDLFSVLPQSGAQWGVIYLLRTGSARFSHRLVTSRLLGGWLPVSARVRDGAIWQGETLVPTPEEQDVLNYCNLPWIEPSLRTDTVCPIRGAGIDMAHWFDAHSAVEPQKGGA